MSTWAPLDLSTVGTVVEKTSILRRADGHALLYAGRLHWLFGEAESGKTWIALCAVAEVLADGGRVVFVDFEDHPEGIVPRLVALGVPREVLNDPSRFAYIRPDEPLLDGSGNVTEQWADLYAALHLTPVALVVLDGVTESMTAEGLELNSNSDVADWVRRLPRPIADHTGAAVVAIDHVTKAKEGRGPYALGGQHKRAAVDGASYEVETVQPLAPVILGGDPREGLVVVRIAKDRPGYVRSVSQGKTAAAFTFTSWPDRGMTWQATAEGVASDHGLRRRIAQLLRGAPGAPKRMLRDLTGKSEIIDAAVAGMIEDGHAHVEIEGNAHRHFLTPAGEEAYPEERPSP